MIQKYLALLFALATSMTLSAAEKSPKPSASALAKSETVVWAGLDYSMVRMYGTLDFKEPERIFPEMLDAWNALFLQELVLHQSERLSKATGKKVKSDTEGMAARNKLAKVDQVIRQDGMYCQETHITDEDIAKAVRSYKLNSKDGLGLIFIVDRFSKIEQKGAVYLVYFDIATRGVISRQRVIVKAAGFSFRNYWFRVVKDAVPALKKLR